MNVVVGDHTGLLKVVSLKTNGQIKKSGSQRKERGGISAMCWAGLQNPEHEVAIGLTSGSVEVWNTAAGELSAELEGMTFANSEDKYVGLDVLRDPNAESGKPSRHLISCLQSGTARITPWFEASILSEEEKAEQSRTVKQSKSSAKAKKAEAESSWVEWRVGSHIEKMKLSPALDVLASGGNENLLALWDVETQGRVFKARNLPEDWLSLRVPNWDTDMCFMPNAEVGGYSQHTTATDSYRIATVNGYRKVRMYDVRASGRPVVDVYHGTEVARAMACTNDGIHLIVGDGAGRIQLLDTRYDMRPVGVLRGQCGSLRSIQVHPTLPMVASVGLDRFLRVHDLQTRKLLKQVYLTQKLTGCLFSSVEPTKGKARSVQSERERKTKERMAETPETEKDLWGEFNRLSAENTKKAKDIAREERFKEKKKAKYEENKMYKGSDDEIEVPKPKKVAQKDSESDSDFGNLSLDSDMEENVEYEFEEVDLNPKSKHEMGQNKRTVSVSSSKSTKMSQSVMPPVETMEEEDLEEDLDNMDEDLEDMDEDLEDMDEDMEDLEDMEDDIEMPATFSFQILDSTNNGLPPKVLHSTNLSTKRDRSVVNPVVTKAAADKQITPVNKKSRR